MSEKPGTFAKGDARINRKGRPKSFDALRALAQSISHEPAIGKDGQPLVIGDHVVTVTEAILRSWAMSKDPRLQMHFIEVTYGKVSDTLDVKSDGGITFIIDRGGDGKAD